jgi:hypothetical protein
MDIKAQEPQQQHHMEQERMNNKVKSTSTQIQQPQEGLKSSFTYA